MSELPVGRTIEPPQRRFPFQAHSFSIVTMGAGTVVSATSAWLPWVKELYEDVSAEAQALAPDTLATVSTELAKRGYRLHGPDHHFVTSSQDIRPIRAPEGYRVEIGGAELAIGLEPTEWPNGLSLHRGEARPTTLVALAKHRGRVVGAASTSADSDEVWQIGIDVSESHRHRRIGAALTSALASAVLREGKIPYYSTSSGNIPSMRTALSAGFHPGWVDLSTQRR